MLAWKTHFSARFLFTLLLRSLHSHLNGREWLRRELALGQAASLGTGEPPGPPSPATFRPERAVGPGTKVPEAGAQEPQRLTTLEKFSGFVAGFPPCTVSWFPAELFANVEREKIGECCALTPIQNPRSIFRPPPGPSAPAQALPARCSPRIQRGWTRSNNPQEGNFLAVLSVGTA